MTDGLENIDADHTCLICGKHLNAHNRSLTQPELCKECAGDEEDTIINI
jgi:hypothetical protein